ncbi:class I SAM-dependent methyltransferase [Geminicoccus flavidas]|uniref:class I SAM-dependent methyltransferase n=1 Tax=Geminicoccus flavidas TaxID=2506407 RepID=UPI00135A7644|nr:class I SAM-dependent methyltransferase [Geminicoccus flavidas]
MPNGWEESAAAWIEDIGEHGDFGRQFVLDAPMLAQLEGRGFKTALDVGCGEGRFCRMLQALGVRTVGIDPTESLIEHAQERDPEGDYRVGRAEALELPDEGFDLVVSYLSLIDIPDIRRAIPEMARVLRPGGTLLIANLTSFNTAGNPPGWFNDRTGQPCFLIDYYLEERACWASWHGIRIRNWHRPLSSYMSLLLEQGLILRHFAEPAPRGGDPAKADRYRRVPYFLIMEWEKPMARSCGQLVT